MNGMGLVERPHRDLRLQGSSFRCVLVWDVTLTEPLSTPDPFRLQSGGWTLRQRGLGQSG